MHSARIFFSASLLSLLASAQAHHEPVRRAAHSDIVAHHAGAATLEAGPQTFVSTFPGGSYQRPPLPR